MMMYNRWDKLEKVIISPLGMDVWGTLVLGTHQLNGMDVWGTLVLWSTPAQWDRCPCVVEHTSSMG